MTRLCARQGPARPVAGSVLTYRVARSRHWRPRPVPAPTHGALQAEIELHGNLAARLSAGEVVPVSSAFQAALPDQPEEGSLSVQLLLLNADVPRLGRAAAHPGASPLRPPPLPPAPAALAGRPARARC